MKTFKDLPLYTGNTKTYAGIGSRHTPPEILRLMERMALILSGAGYTLNSGGAKGADSAFENGALRKQIFYPFDADDETRNIASELHKNYNNLSDYDKNLIARNTYQIFGIDLDKPVDFVLCYTPDGCESYQTRTKDTGGTGQTIEMASRKNIPVINMANKDWNVRLFNIVKI